MSRRQLELTVRASCPKGMTPAHFRQLIRAQLHGEVYLSIHDMIVADTNAGSIRPSVSAARIVRKP